MAPSDPTAPAPSPAPALRFEDVSGEFRHLVARRRDLLTLVGSIFAGLGVLLSNAMEGKLPDELGTIRDHLFASYATLLVVPSLLIALRMARLHGGMVLNGMLVARFVEGQPFARGWTVAGARKHNPLGVSTLQLVLVGWLAAFSAAILALTLSARLALAGAAGLVTAMVVVAMYHHAHRRAAAAADAIIARGRFEPATEDQWRHHISGSLGDANDHLNGDVAFVGLMVFSVFETLSAFGKMPAGVADVATLDIRDFGPSAYVVLMVVTCLIGLVTHARVRVALGRFSLLLDPADRPFRPLVLTDSLLSFATLAFLFAVSVHLLQGLPWNSRRGDLHLMVGVDLAAFALAVAVHQAMLVLAGRKYARR